MTKWQSIELRRIVEFRNGVNFSQEDEGRGIPILKVKDFGDLHFAPETGLDELDAGRVNVPSSQYLNPGDILIVRSNGNRELVGRSMIFGGPPKRVTFSGFCIRARVTEDCASPEYIHYWLRSPLTRQTFSREGNGTGISNISQGFLGEQKVNLPSVAEQKAITAVLSALDDKIELNRRINETLEGMAQAIFKDWFIDFGPVRRKLAGVTDPVAIMGGLAPTQAPELAALFPDGFGDDGLPEGWENQEIGSLIDIAGGSTPSTADKALWEPAEHWWATPKDLSSMSDLALFATERRISSAGLSRITSGVLPVGTVLLSSRAPIGYLAIAQVPVSINQGFIALKPNDVFGSAYLYLWCKANMDQIVANANGSTFQEISKKNFRPIKTALPLEGSLVQEFCKISQQLIDRIVLAAQENRTLAETRDYLLPKLMSGEVRVRDAERMVG
jgi:type I restriction enzyme, S subunit